MEATLSTSAMKSTPTIEECVVSVCRIPKDRGHESFTAACRKTGYDKFRSQVTFELIEAELRKSPELIDYWLGWSSDKRCSPAWYFIDRPVHKWAVGYYHNDPSKRTETFYEDRFIACARFVKDELEEWASQPYLLKRFL